MEHKFSVLVCQNFPTLLQKWRITEISSLIQYNNSIWAFIFIIFITGIHFADIYIAFTSFRRGKKNRVKVLGGG